MSLKSFVLALTLALPFVALAEEEPRQVEVRVQKTSMTREQEIELGRSYAAQVEREMEVVRDPEIESWLNKIGRQLAQAPQANAYPYHFKLIRDDSINAFALPGGPMYVNTGLLKAADSEGEVVGVLAHEMSHVALRHSAAQMGKQKSYGTLFGVLGAVTGVVASGDGGCGLFCQAAQKGVELGGSSVLMKFSRGYERDADLNGARMMASIGYDPLALPRFFEKLQSEQGKAGEPSGLSLWLASHPATGSRIELVTEDVRFYPRREYTAGTGEFAQIKKRVAALPPAHMSLAKLMEPKEKAAPRTDLPPDFVALAANGFSVGVPRGWQAVQPQTGGGVYLAPKNGLASDGNSGVELIYGALIDYYAPARPAEGKSALAEHTQEFLAGLRAQDKNLRAGPPESARIGSHAALRTQLTTRIASAQGAPQTIYLYTVEQPGGLWYIALAAPGARLEEFHPLAEKMAASVQLAY